MISQSSDKSVKKYSNSRQVSAASSSELSPQSSSPSHFQPAKIQRPLLQRKRLLGQVTGAETPQHFKEWKPSATLFLCWWKILIKTPSWVSHSSGHSWYMHASIPHNNINTHTHTHTHTHTYTHTHTHKGAQDECNQEWGRVLHYIKGWRQVRR